MKNTNKMTNEKLFPIYFNGKNYYKKDCDDVFLAFYHCIESLNGLGGVYLSEGIWVYPDGSMDDFSEGIWVYPDGSMDDF